MTPIAVTTTVDSLDDAQALARSLVERRLAACAQISTIESFYRWDGTVQHEPEFRILFKTVAERYAAVEEAIRTQHPYELPAIHGVALPWVDARYEEWIVANVTPAD